MDYEYWHSMPYEVTRYTDPTKADTDGDGVSDGEELQLGWDPTSADGLLYDQDGDGLTWVEEWRAGTSDTNADTDGDGLSDWQELRDLPILLAGTNHPPFDPLNPADGAADYDGDGLSNAYEINISLTDFLNPDTDGDGLPDGYEVAEGFEPNDPDDALLDGDGDGLNRLEEYALGTSDNQIDSDGDGLTDWQELYELSALLAGTDHPPFDPLNPADGLADYDGDGLSNAHEINLSLTDFLHPDSDGDGLPDGYEVAEGFDPNVPDDVLLDGDGDGLNRLEEYALGTSDNRIDSDGDGLSDWQELHELPALLTGTDHSPFDPTNPADGQADYDGDGLSNAFEIRWSLTDFLHPDSDGDGLPDGYEIERGYEPTDPGDALIDGDGDGLNRLQEYQAGTSDENWDSDGDGLSDWQEIMELTPVMLLLELPPFDPTDPTDGLADYDGDGLSNAEEYDLYQTDLLEADTDGDGYSDYEEIMVLGSDPLDPNDPTPQEGNPEDPEDPENPGEGGTGGEPGSPGIVLPRVGGTSMGQWIDPGQVKTGHGQTIQTQSGNGSGNGSSESQGGGLDKLGDALYIEYRKVLMSYSGYYHKEYVEPEGYWEGGDWVWQWMGDDENGEPIYEQVWEGGTYITWPPDDSPGELRYRATASYWSNGEWKFDHVSDLNSEQQAIDFLNGKWPEGEDGWEKLTGPSLSAYFHSETTGEIEPAANGIGVKYEFRMVRGSAAPRNLKRTFIKPLLEREMWGELEQVKRVDHLTLAMPEGGKESSVAESSEEKTEALRLVTDIRPDMDESVSLVPVEVVIPEVKIDNDGYRSETGEEIVADGLKVAQWENLFQGETANPEVSSVFPATDRDRFKIKVGGKIKDLKAYIETIAADGSQIDDGTEIALNEVQGEHRMETEWNILVTSEMDDGFRNSLGPVDNEPPNDYGGLKRSDRTHLVSAVADKVKVTLELPGGQFQEFEFELATHQSKVIEVPVTAVIYNVEPNSYNPVPIVSESYVHDDVAEANKRLAQSNIVLKVKRIVRRDPPESLINGLQIKPLSDINGDHIESPYRTILENPATAEKDLELHYVTYLTNGFNGVFEHTLGVSITSSVSGHPNYGLPAGSQGIMIISAPFSSYAQMNDPQASQEREEFKIVTGHEVGHALSDRGHYDGDTVGLDPYPQNVQGNHYPDQNLMRSGNGWYIGPSSVFGNLRIWDKQVQWFRDGALDMGGRYFGAK